MLLSVNILDLIDTVGQVAEISKIRNFGGFREANGLCAEYHGQIGRILKMRMMKADKRLCLAVVGASLALCAKLSPFDVGAAEV